ncbi:MAG: hypothetical protein R3B57_12460 [Phycisphaerales bacterium]
MDTVCPKCHADIPPDDINVGENVAYCRACDTVHKLSELAEREDLDEAASESVPAGAWLRDDGNETRLGATMRSTGTAIFFILFSGFWNSIVLVFLANVIASFFGAKVPITQGEHGTPHTMRRDEAWFLLLFLIPFILVGLGTFVVALMALFGKVEIALRSGDGRAFTGLGPVGWTRRFDSTRVKSVSIETADSSTNGKPDRQIVIDAADRTVKIGTTLSRARRRWLAGALQRMLVPDQSRPRAR